jgi:hypothetical protein
MVCELQHRQQRLAWVVVVVVGLRTCLTSALSRTSTLTNAPITCAVPDMPPATTPLLLVIARNSVAPRVTVEALLAIAIEQNNVVVAIRKCTESISTAAAVNIV